jgi:hypothetical protein
MKTIAFGIVIAAAASLSAQNTRWTPLRTVDGQPDLQGTWANNTVAPLERPAELAGRTTLTDAEVATLKARSARLFDGGGDAAFGDQLFATLLANPDQFTSSDGKTGDYNHFWVSERVIDNRTSLITDPADGRIPPMLPAAQQRRAARAAARPTLPRGPEDRSISERCITFGVPRVQAELSYFDITQSRDAVVLRMERIHDPRIVWLDGRPHLGNKIRNVLGDSRGHWEGDTLVVETTNFSPQNDFYGSHENLHLTERFRLDSQDQLRYEFTAADDTTWVRPWTVMIPLQRSRAPIFEYACHEGNLGLAGILAGARAQEREQ